MVCHDYLFKCCLWVFLIDIDKKSSLRVPLSPCWSTVSVFHHIACCYLGSYRVRQELTPMRSNCQLPDLWTVGPAMSGRSPTSFCLRVPLIGLPSLCLDQRTFSSTSKRIPCFRRHRPSLPHAQKHLFCWPRFCRMVRTMLLLCVMHTPLF